MKLHVGLIVVCAALYVGASDPKPSESKEQILSFEDRMLGFTLELLLAKLEAMEQKLQEMQNDLNQQRSSQEENRTKIFSALQKLDQDVALVLQDRSCHNLSQRTVTVLSKQNQCADNSAPQIKTPTPKPRQSPFSSCKDVPTDVSGIYTIRLNYDSEPFKVYCDQKSFGGGWNVIQHRYDGSLDFYRGWDEFRDGFGDLDREFWLGLEKVHQMTKSHKHELIVELKSFDGVYKYARYDDFEIGNERKKYALQHIGSYSGTAGDAMKGLKGMKFTTKDRDYDRYGSGQCAHYHEGAWWHKDCTFTNLNGRHVNTVERKTMFWYPFTNKEQGLSFSRMMIRGLE
ncbi:fibroleukin-like [Anopheles darlingi]|uniref:fibroleukin-like n=1 Tax=Anopheles darlingi TaxID=43151 RepID=UPI00210037BC|nr:fibroleukin-like [Anopheles darlingi]